MNIDFVDPSRPSRNAWTAVGMVWLLVLILGVLFVYLHARVERAREGQLAAAALANTPVAVAAPRVVPPYQDEAVALLKRAALPEADALAELENVAVNGIQLRSIDVNPAVSTVVVELEAASDAVLGDYLDQLNAGMPAPRWHIKRVAALADTQSSTIGAALNFGATGATRSATIARDI